MTLLIDYTTEKVLRELCRVNQYFYFSENDIIGLKYIYRNLYQNITKNELSLNIVSKTHYKNIKKWLEKSNPFSSKNYQHSGAVLEAVICSEYSSELQKDIFLLVHCNG